MSDLVGKIFLFTLVGGIVLAALIAAVVDSAEFKEWKRRRGERKSKMQDDAARWHAVSGVEEGGTYRLRINLIRPDGQVIESIEKWSCNVNDDEFVNVRGLRIGEARALCDDLNAEKDHDTL